METGETSRAPTDDPVAKVHVSLEWVGGDPTMESRDDGYFRFCGVPTGKLVLVRASAGKLMATTTSRSPAAPVVHAVDVTGPCAGDSLIVWSHVSAYRECLAREST